MDDNEKVYCDFCGEELEYALEGSLDGACLCESCWEEEDMFVMEHFFLD